MLNFISLFKLIPIINCKQKCIHESDLYVLLSVEVDSVVLGAEVKFIGIVLMTKYRESNTK